MDHFHPFGGQLLPVQLMYRSTADFKETKLAMYGPIYVRSPTSYRSIYIVSVINMLVIIKLPVNLMYKVALLCSIANSIIYTIPGYPLSYSAQYFNI